MQHGTPAGYRQHYRLGTTPCQPCKQARADHNRAAAEKRNEYKRLRRTFNPSVPLPLNPTYQVRTLRRPPTADQPIGLPADMLLPHHISAEDEFLARHDDY